MTHSVAKLIIKDPSDHFLVLERSKHPYFPYEADLPGGIIEEGEGVIEGLARELQEEIQFVPENLEQATRLYSGTDYSRSGLVYDLYGICVPVRPDIAISWEHESYEWVSRDVFHKLSRKALDSYMQMVTATVENMENW